MVRFIQTKDRNNKANRATGQTFGVDLEARARADRKRVPLIVTTILTYLDNREFHLRFALLLAHIANIA
jgi:hypothetical protein